MNRALQSLWADESAATMVEYAIMAALIAGIGVTAVGALGISVRDTLFTRIVSRFP